MSSSLSVKSESELNVSSSAQCANDTSIQQAAQMEPEQIKGPNMLERAGDEIAAIAGTAKVREE